MAERAGDQIDHPPFDADQRTLLGVMAHLAAGFGPPTGDTQEWAGQIREAALALLVELPQLQADHATLATTKHLSGTVVSIEPRDLSPGLRRGYIKVRPDVGRFDDSMWTESLDDPAGRDQFAAVEALVGHHVTYQKVTVNRDGARGYGRLQHIAASTP